MESEAAIGLRQLACRRCSRRKQRCDRVLPSCSQCAKANVACDPGDNDSFITESGNRVALKKGYVRLLEERVENLENQVSQRNAFSKSGDSMRELDERSATTRGPLPMMDPFQLTTPVPDASDMNIELLTLSAMAEPRRRKDEFLKELSMSRIISCVTETYGGDPERTVRSDAIWDGIARSIRHTLQGQVPRLSFPRKDAEKYLERYIAEVDFRYPRIPRYKTQSGIDVITAAGHDDFMEMLSRDPANIFFAYMVIAIVSLVSDTYAIAQGSFISTHLLAQALRVLDKVFLKEDGVDVIQCLQLLVIFSLHTSTAGSSWHLSGIAMKKCVALGYHRESHLDLPDSEREARRWAFWGCYYLDQLISRTLGRPPSLKDRHILVRMPTKDGLHSPGQPLKPQVHLFRYAQIMSDITLDQGRHEFHEHLGTLLYWKASTSCETSMSRAAIAYQTSLYNTLLLRILIDQIVRTPYLSNPPQSDGTTSVTVPLQQMKEEADRFRLLPTCKAIVESLKRPEMAKRSFLSWITGYSAFATSLTLLYHNSLIIKDKGQAFSSYSNEAEQAVSSSDSLLASLMQTLATVDAQFPRFKDMRVVVASLRWALDGSCLEGCHSLDFRLAPQRQSDIVSGIAPAHLRGLGALVMRISLLA